MVYCGGFLVKLGLFAWFSLYTIHFAVTNSEAAKGSAACFYEILWPARQKTSSLREQTAKNARSFKLSDRFERCANSFFDSSLIALHSFSFAQKIKDHSTLLSVRSIYKSDVPSSANHKNRIISHLSYQNGYSFNTKSGNLSTS